jgi:hypothetical protein
MNIAFAVIDHKQNYYDFYDELLNFIKRHFANVESGIQGDAWIWVLQDKQKVSIDTFYSMQFEIQSESNCDLLQSVLKTIQSKYPVNRYNTPIER